MRGLSPPCTTPSACARSSAAATPSTISTARRGANAPDSSSAAFEIDAGQLVHEEEEVAVVAVAAVVDADEVLVAGRGELLQLGPQLRRVLLLRQLAMHDLDGHLRAHRGPRRDRPGPSALRRCSSMTSYPPNVLPTSGPSSPAGGTAAGNGVSAVLGTCFDIALPLSYMQDRAEHRPTCGCE